MVQENPIGYFSAFTTYLGYAVLISFGHVRDFFGRLTRRSRYLNRPVAKGYAPLLKEWESFYTRRMYHRIQDCWNRPINSAPGAYIDVMHRGSKDGNKTLYTTGETKHCLNLGSYNYLGFADDWMATCGDRVLKELNQAGASTCSSRSDLGTHALHVELEETVADFLGKPAAMVFTMGYGTNSTTIPALMGKGSLIVSDSLNHTSMVNGARASGAKIKVFRHNDPEHLEQVLRAAIADGQPRTHRPWTKILVMVEGIYSMEGEILDLPGIVKVSKRYNAYIYLDEAHSIGAIGPTGRGVCEYHGVDTADIDIMMGTFTKSFGSMGGYIAGSKQLIAYLRSHSAGSLYQTAMSPVLTAQVLTAFNVLTGKDGTDLGARKLRDLKENSNYFRQALIDMGLEVIGDFDSPVIPVMLYNPTKIPAFSRFCFDAGLAVVVVGFPATPLVLSRTRFCISAAHSRKDLVEAVKVIKEIATKCRIRYNYSMFG
eukprot:PLAT14791.1.p1 GENE.PLAT14791.1~~PLAT14791.1.p1  ORF type:complete len:485 (-),score=222.29 PLAT14791.1:186-1640(-)